MTLTDMLLQLLIFNMPKMSSDNDIKHYIFETLPLYDDELPSTRSELEKDPPPKMIYDSLEHPKTW
jgi:hypothetical protein